MTLKGTAVPTQHPAKHHCHCFRGVLLAEKPEPPPPPGNNNDPDTYKPKRDTREAVIAALRELMHLGPDDPAPVPPAQVKKEDEEGAAVDKKTDDKKADETKTDEKKPDAKTPDVKKSSDAAPGGAAKQGTR